MSGNNLIEFKEKILEIDTAIKWRNFSYDCYYNNCHLHISTEVDPLGLKAVITNRLNDEIWCFFNFNLDDRIYPDKPLLDEDNLNNWINKIKGTIELMEE